MPGRKRGLAVDVLGLVVAVVVLAASAHDNAAGTAPLDRTRFSIKITRVRRAGRFTSRSAPPARKWFVIFYPMAPMGRVFPVEVVALMPVAVPSRR